MTPNQAAQKIAHLEEVIKLMGQAQKRLRAAMETATAYTWTTADGRNVRVEHLLGSGWYVRINGDTAAPGSRELSATLDLAARLAPPADADLAELLTSTSCGHPRT